MTDILHGRRWDAVRLGLRLHTDFARRQESCRPQIATIGGLMQGRLVQDTVDR